MAKIELDVHIMTMNDEFRNDTVGEKHISIKSKLIKVKYRNRGEDRSPESV